MAGNRAPRRCWANLDGWVAKTLALLKPISSDRLGRHSTKHALTPVKLDFDARVPIPFSVFPSSYRNEDAAVDSQTTVKVEEQVGGREDTEARYRYDSRTNRRDSNRVDRRDTRIYEERDRFDNRRGRREDIDVDVDINVDQGRYQQPYRRYADAQLDVNERSYDRDGNVVDTNIDIDVDARRGDYRRSGADFVERERVTFEDREPEHRRDMGYYDDEGHYHSFRHGLHRAADRVIHPFDGGHHHHHHGGRDYDRREEVDVDVDVNVGPGPRIRETGVVRDTSYRDDRIDYVPRSRPNTITIPCHHIRVGDLLILQGRACQVIRITTSSSTGQHRYLGVDLFTKQLYEESSFASNPSSSVYVQNMLGPVFKQYRILDIRSDGRVVAMTESGDIKQGLPIIDQSQVYERMSAAFDNGRGSVRVLVINDQGRELGVDFKVIHGSRL